MNDNEKRAWSRFADAAKAAPSVRLGAVATGQRWPDHSPCPGEQPGTSVDANPLGPPMGISDVAAFLGCSVWTVRQRYMRQGLPHLRTSATGKLVFFRKQVIDWIVNRQLRQKGGIPR